MRAATAVALLFAAASNAAGESSRSQDPASFDAPPVHGMRIHVTAPPGAGNYPVLFFVSGFAAEAPLSLYSDLLLRVARKGYVIAGVDHGLAWPDYPALARSFRLVLDWARNGGLQLALGKQGLSAVADVAYRLAVAGQSTGSHVVANALAQDCSGAQAAVLIDPVDGADPYHVNSSHNIIIDGQKVNFTIPTLFFDNGLDQHHLPLEPACMEVGLGTDHWMAGWKGPFWRVNATEYGHIDCLNSQTLGQIVCPTTKSTDKALYRQTIADTMHIFLSALFAGHQQNFHKLEDPGQFQIAVTLNHDLKGLAYDQIAPGCIQDPSFDSILV
eukprot:TRINITY_DN121819_c0_g1_i1.p1 TRINITY_DN121819_c0_g1~~TRINITY_DN121819_c0_g1_i1.p1  ORF type:complete len:349 (-),score=51.61 TRINITY_DN121819_c0_g1_i1:198-1184(-)